MTEQLKYILFWFNSLGISDINENKLKRQLSIITNFFKVNCIGVIECVTGFGKTLVAIILIHRFNIKYVNQKIIVVVPLVNLYKDWISHIEKFQLKNVEVYVINTYVQLFLDSKIKHDCAFLIIDEVHHVLSKEALIFNQVIKCTNYSMFLGMSATLNDKEKDILSELNIPIFDKVDMNEARIFDYVSDYVIYNYGIKLNKEQRELYDKLNDTHNSNYAKFLYFVENDKNWELIRACSVGKDVKVKVGDSFKTGSQWRDWYSRTMEWDGTDEHPWHPKAISKYAQLWNWAMVERKNFLYKNELKLLVAKQIIDTLNLQTITFSEITEFADKLTSILGGKAKSFHSNIKTTLLDKEVEIRRTNFKSAKLLRQRTSGVLTVDQETKEYIIKYTKQVKISGKTLNNITLKEFEKGIFTVLNTSKALDEGLNIENIELALICSSSSQRRQNVQRSGRALRFKEGKKAIIINLYFIDTQDEAWLKKRQKGETKVRWITKLEEII